MYVICATFRKMCHVYSLKFFHKSVNISKKVAKARLYMTALGVYKTFIDGKKVGNEFLAPGVDDYTQWIQVQTYDVTENLQKGEHDLLISTTVY